MSDPQCACPISRHPGHQVYHSADCWVVSLSGAHREIKRLTEELADVPVLLKTISTVVAERDGLYARNAVLKHDGDRLRSALQEIISIPHARSETRFPSERDQLARAHGIAREALAVQNDANRTPVDSGTGVELNHD